MSEFLHILLNFLVPILQEAAILNFVAEIRFKIFTLVNKWVGCLGEKCFFRLQLGSGILTIYELFISDSDLLGIWSILVQIYGNQSSYWQ